MTLDPAAVARLEAFVTRAENLTPEAWARIAARCAQLDHGLGAALGRLELYARAWGPDADPYERPLMRPALGMLGTMAGLLAEVVDILPGAPPDHVTTLTGPGAAFHRALHLAHRQHATHPGTTAAVRAVAIGLLWSTQVRGMALDRLYQPFEPEIPFASLTPAADEAA